MASIIPKHDQIFLRLGDVQADKFPGITTIPPTILKVEKDENAFLAAPAVWEKKRRALGMAFKDIYHRKL